MNKASILKITLGLLVLAVVGTLFYLQYKKRQETSAQEELAEILHKQGYKNPNAYFDLSKKYPKTKAGKTAIYCAAVALEGQGKEKEAIDTFKRYIAKGTQFFWPDEAKYHIGMCYYKLKQYENALVYFKEASDGPLQKARCLEDIAAIYKILGKKEEALRVLEQLYSEYPHNPDSENPRYNNWEKWRALLRQELNPF